MHSLWDDDEFDREFHASMRRVNRFAFVGAIIWGAMLLAGGAFVVWITLRLLAHFGVA